MQFVQSIIEIYHGCHYLKSPLEYLFLHNLNIYIILNGLYTQSTAVTLVKQAKSVYPDLKIHKKGMMYFETLPFDKRDHEQREC